ncbi:tRNA (adenosine(37)-N6)-threonylcarbamoyltransferase complex ATPase subunit type 1 TsaE [Acetobacter sp.]|jgi:tRNA threonylcarbamoyladenosine biosynthesis protein TsaE|uniref:tRNA (adenosine(37)-N6)-threonylcarbamoyltransferase complex ATPase subunit type 1 TsaE n=1 Tax=Acetobacter sp. TaxID=440 RepID=UPI0025C6E529|nr:tRNA (adenosine(37)-N6)-threonylcarbamoyltransferase complex ATPase subunit type 1 TsaE [Acetobacter sp.]MCH4092112.1 tRNA (adenosine(37)-N6)-threonylcarbamoyltransferase complex ATPase subunit type 1 TsaE [Acetobacter sp.]MCI1299971.1 tRNA (adenosine(37)-N6)-threonylcarbamoyltransferase complex ATPase subunit type 1 TsaE [Acetobacter sp.]MCI1315989.1 tRNA (adenosine(37)-N6)-threonylcarbamoyltransferase complex ATPase subunit type 1 TsaE [Acetobacter sp.]
MTSRNLMLNTRSETEALARRLAGLTRSGDAILLSGPLGAGKSVFARAFLRALCNDPTLDVPSPTFTLVQPYDSPQGGVSHFDLWRLQGPEALEELGWDDARTGIVLVEWPERLEDLTPADALHVTLKPRPVAGQDPDVEDLPREAVLTGWADRL